MNMGGAPAQLPLRDIHLPPAPPAWPPAPGWWLVALLVLAVALAVSALRLRRQRRRHAIARLFDEAVTQASTPSARIAAMSELLRRAARNIDPVADTLSSDEWLRFLDRGMEVPVFEAGPGSLLRDGAFRGDVTDREVDALQPLARARFLAWMAQ